MLILQKELPEPPRVIVPQSYCDKIVIHTKWLAQCKTQDRCSVNRCLGCLGQAEACLMVSRPRGDSSKHHMLVPLPSHVLFKSYGGTTEVQQTDTWKGYSLMNLNTCIQLTRETIPTVKIMKKSVIPSMSPCGFKIQPFLGHLLSWVIPDLLPSLKVSSCLLDL